ncbi:MAG: hypothetical protein ACHQVS_02140 [Candidatus Babeliales bacterium]
MKKLLIATMLIISTPVLAELAFYHNGVPYSRGAASNVNQQEYQWLFGYCLQHFYPRGYAELSAYELSVIFRYLKGIGTPAALRLIHDLEEMIKEGRKDMKRIEKL